MIIKEQQTIKNDENFEYQLTEVNITSHENADEYERLLQLQFKDELKKCIDFKFPQLQNQQMFCLLSVIKNYTQQNLDPIINKNILIDDKFTFGSLDKLQFLNFVIIPNDYVIPDCEIIQCLLTKNQTRLSYSFIMFLFILKQLEIVVPITAIKLIKEFVFERPYLIMDIGREKMVQIWLHSDDPRNVLYKNDEIILGKDIKMVVKSIKSIESELIDMQLKVNLKNVQSFLKDIKTEIIGISFQVQMILRQLIEAYDVSELEQYMEFYQAFIQSPLLVLEIPNDKFIAICGFEGEYYQFGSSYNLQGTNRIINEQIDNYQFYVYYHQNEWRLYDGKNNYPNNDKLKSKYGTWKIIQNKQFQLRPSDTFRINQHYFNIKDLKENNQQKHPQNSCYCSEIMQKGVSEIPEIRQINKLSTKFYHEPNQFKKQIPIFKEYYDLQLDQEYNLIEKII